MSTLTPILPRPIRQLVSLLLVSILTLSACAPLPGPSVGLTPNPQPATPTPDPLTGASWVGSVPETPAGAATGLPVGQAFVDLSSNGAAVPRWILSAGEVEHLKTLLDRLPPVECPPIAEPAGYRGIVVVLGAGDQGVRHAYGGWVWRGSPAAMNPQTTCQLDPSRSVEQFLLNSAQPYLDPSLFGTIMAELSLPLPAPAGRPGYALYQGNSYASRSEPRRQFQIIYDTRQWQLADNNLELRHIPSCTLHLVGTGKGISGSMVTDQVVLADHTWRRQSVLSENSVFYALDFDDNFYLFELSLPNNTPAETASQCQTSAETVIATFEAIEQ